MIPQGSAFPFMLHSRNKRVSEAIRQSLSRILQQEASDPRLPAIFTITGVTLSKDLRHATVHFSQLPDGEEDLDRTAEFLDSSTGYLRSLVAKDVNTKFCPELRFRYDASPANYQGINDVLQELRRKGEDLDSPPSAEE